MSRRMRKSAKAVPRQHDDRIPPEAALRCPANAAVARTSRRQKRPIRHLAWLSRESAAQRLLQPMPGVSALAGSERKPGQNERPRKQNARHPRPQTPNGEPSGPGCQPEPAQEPPEPNQAANALTTQTNKNRDQTCPTCNPPHPVAKLTTFFEWTHNTITPNSIRLFSNDHKYSPSCAANT